MLHPRYELEVGSSTFDPENSPRVMFIQNALSMDVPINSLRFSLNSLGEKPVIEHDSKVSLKLGYDDELDRVFTGRLEAYNSEYTKFYCYSLSSFSRLCLLKVDRFYEQEYSGEIVKDLCSIADVKSAEIVNGLQLPFFVVDSNKSIYDHIRELSVSNGLEVYANHMDELVFKEYKPSDKHDLNYGEDLMMIDRLDQHNPIRSVRVIGESPSGSKGSQTVHWLTKQRVQSVAGREDGVQEVMFKGIIRDEDTAGNVADSILHRIESTILVSIQIVGNPKIRLGDTVKINNAPDKILNNEYQVCDVQHYLSKISGFTTTLKCREVRKRSQ